MIWFGKQNDQKQIITSAKEFGLFTKFGLLTEMSFEKFTEETCPIPLKEFENYEGIPLEIIAQGFAALKNYLSSFGPANFICFVGPK